jgi:3-oxoacyl-(acyl-carrier-protein) synthase III
MSMMKEFVINRHGQLVLPCNFLPEVDFSVFETLEQFTSVIARDFGEKAPSEVDIMNRLQNGKYRNRYELCRDLALHLYWVNRYSLTMYEKRPTRWADLPRHSDDLFLPACKPWDSEGAATLVETGYGALPAKWDIETEDLCFRSLLDGLRNNPSPGGDLGAIQPTVAELITHPRSHTLRLSAFNPDYPAYGYDDLVDYKHDTPELVALMRQSMILHNQYRWDPAASACVEVRQLKDDDYVIALYPRSSEVLKFISRVQRHQAPRSSRLRLPSTPALAAPIEPYKPVDVRSQFAIMPRIESLSVYEGEVPCTNIDLIRNHAYNWSRMTEAEILQKTGIEQRCYSELKLEEMALIAAHEALTKAKRKPSEIGAVLFCSCTSTRLIPSVACWLSGELGIMQTRASCDIVAACAGMPYGFAEAVRILQEVNRPVLVVCAEKFSDKIGNVRTSRMIFGDGAAAVVIGPAPEGMAPDIEVIQTYAGGPWSEVNSIIWPNQEFDNNITVYGPEVKSLVQRYLSQMMQELGTLRTEDGQSSLIDAVDIVVPHQANKTMVETLAEAAGVTRDRLFFNIQRVGNTSSASILLAIRDAVVGNRIDRKMRVFAPAFGAGAVGGYVVMNIDPAIVSRGTLPLAECDEDMHSKSLAGKVALVASASRGIGRAIALELAGRGASIAINLSSDTKAAESIAQEVRSLGVACMVVKGNVANNEEAQEIIGTVLGEWQRLDILVNNAGVARSRSFQKMTDNEWEQVVEGNLNGTFHATSAALPAMINQRFGRIINISSAVCQAGAFGHASHSATSGGILAFTKSVAMETAKYNITANSIAPGYTSTDLEHEIPEHNVIRIKAQIPLGRFATPKEVAKAAGFLAAEADYITGQELNVNGGSSM